MLKRIRPMVVAMFREGTQLGGTETIRVAEKARVDDFPDGDIGDLLGQAAEDYMEEWWSQFEATTRRRLRVLLDQAVAANMTPKQAAKLLAPILGAERASIVAITEMTRIMGAAAVARYQAAGVPEWQWQTVQDERVDPACEERQDMVFPIAQPFEPLHPRCRCWPVPFTDNMELVQPLVT